MHLRHEGPCVVYTAMSGFEYRIDVASMQQLNAKTGSRRAVSRKHLKKLYGYDKLPHWELGPATDAARNDKQEALEQTKKPEKKGVTFADPTHGDRESSSNLADTLPTCVTHYVLSNFYSNFWLIFVKL